MKLKTKRTRKKFEKLNIFQKYISQKKCVREFLAYRVRGVFLCLWFRLFPEEMRGEKAPS